MPRFAVSSCILSLLASPFITFRTAVYLFVIVTIVSDRSSSSSNGIFVNSLKIQYRIQRRMDGFRNLVLGRSGRSRGPQSQETLFGKWRRKLCSRGADDTTASGSSGTQLHGSSIPLNAGCYNDDIAPGSSFQQSSCGCGTINEEDDIRSQTGLQDFLSHLNAIELREHGPEHGVRKCDFASIIAGVNEEDGEVFGSCENARQLYELSMRPDEEQFDEKAGDDGPGANAADVVVASTDSTDSHSVASGKKLNALANKVQPSRNKFAKYGKIPDREDDKDASSAHRNTSFYMDGLPSSDDEFTQKDTQQRQRPRKNSGGYGPTVSFELCDDSQLNSYGSQMSCGSSCSKFGGTRVRTKSIESGTSTQYIPGSSLTSCDTSMASDSTETEEPIGQQALNPEFTKAFIVEEEDEEGADEGCDNDVSDTRRPEPLSHRLSKAFLHALPGEEEDQQYQKTTRDDEKSSGQNG